MKSPCPEPRLGRCRVRDLVASCFNTCRLPLEEEEEPPPATSVASTASVKTSSKKPSHNSGGGGGGRAAEGEPRFAEEDYIVFCFGEDGEIHMISNDRKSSETQPSKMHRKNEQPNGSKLESSFQSCDSSLSESSSSSSFAFPAVVGMEMEWIGSPFHMPNANAECCKICRHNYS